MSSKANKYQHDDHVPHEEHGGEEGWLVSYADMMTLLVGFFVILMSFSEINQEKFEEAKKSITKEFGGQYERPYGDIADKIKGALDKAGVGNQVMIKTDESGVEISFLGTAFFETGSVDVKAEAQRLFNSVIPQIKTESSDFSIVIEGHTDDVPLAGGGLIRNNWELSSIRACRVLDFFLAQGFSKDRVTAVGYGEARPMVPNRDANGVAIPTNQAQNRRVVIKLMKGKGKTL